MNEPKRPLTGQELDQAFRTQEMRKFREQQSDEPGERQPPKEESASAKAQPEKDETAGEEPELTALIARPDDLDSLLEPGPPVPVLSSAKPPGASPVRCDTETLLNDLIVECHSLLRDVAFRSACLTSDADDRIRFISAAESLAITAAKVGETIARLRVRGASAVKERRHRMIYEHVQPPPSPPEDTP